MYFVIKYVRTKMPGTTMAGHGWPSNIHGWPWLVTEQEQPPWLAMPGHFCKFGHVGHSDVWPWCHVKPLAGRPLLPKCVDIINGRHFRHHQRKSRHPRQLDKAPPMYCQCRSMPGLYLSRCSKQAGAHKLFVMLSCALSCPKLERR